uniref:Pro-neuregulin-4, membrane-bound isoform n=1 Tax=Prolemur simus TaxID=1328070 RepID=A0A8C8YTW4_PROSS
MPTDHEEPCGPSHRSFCLNGGICYVIPTIPSPFCSNIVVPVRPEDFVELTTKHLKLFCNIYELLFFCSLTEMRGIQSKFKILLCKRIERWNL